MGSAQQTRRLFLPAKEELLRRRFAVTRSGAYRLERVPVWAFIERQRWPDVGETSPRADWRVFIGPPGAAWSDGELSEVLVMLSQDDQRDGSDKYRLETPEDETIFVRDFERYTLPLLDVSEDPATLARELLAGRIAPFHGRRRNRLGSVEAALAVAQAHSLEGGLISEAGPILAEESAISDERARRADQIRQRFHIA